MSPNSQTKSYLTPKEAAAYLKVSTETVRQWAKTGQLKAELTLGGHRRFRIDEVERFASGLRIRRGTNCTPRVLIVDDDKQFVKLVEEILKTCSEDIITSSAFDGFEAGHKVNTFKPSIILLDLVMPNSNGIEVCRYLKANDHTKDIRILATTGYTSELNVHNFINAGAEVVLDKPLDMELLKDLVLADYQRSAE